MTARMRRAGGVAALLAALVASSWSLASASSLEVDGGVLHYWEIDADLPAVAPASEPEPDAQGAESDGSQELFESGAEDEQPRPPAPGGSSQPEAAESAPGVTESTTAETESDTPAGPSAGSDSQPIADPPVTAP